MTRYTVTERTCHAVCNACHPQAVWRQYLPHLLFGPNYVPCMRSYTTDSTFDLASKDVLAHARRLAGRPNVQLTASIRNGYRLVLTSGDVGPDTGIPVLYRASDYVPSNTAADLAAMALKTLYRCIPRVSSGKRRTIA